MLVWTMTPWTLTDNMVSAMCVYVGLVLSRVACAGHRGEPGDAVSHRLGEGQDLMYAVDRDEAHLQAPGLFAPSPVVLSEIEGMPVSAISLHRH